MRNLDRIPVVLEAVERAWRKNPDMRLGQLLTVATKNLDFYNVEDGRLLCRLEKVYGITLTPNQKTYASSEPKQQADAWSDFLRLAESEILPRLRKLFDR